MKDRYVIHIGTHKTGTTSIQAFFAANRLTLLQRGIDFPLVGRTHAGAQAHRNFSAFFRNLSHEHPQGIERLLRLGFTDAPRCFLSSEDFYYLHTPRQVRTLSAALGGRTQVICVLREPVSHIMSMYKEALKGGETRSLPEYVRGMARGFAEPVSFNYYAYAANMTRWREFHDVTVIPYRSSGLIDGVLDAAGFDIPMWQCAPVDHVNASFGDMEAIFRLAINRMAADRPARRKELRVMSKRLQKLSRRGVVPDLPISCRQVELDVSDFVDAFRAANAEFEELVNAAPRKLKFFETVSLDHETLVLRLASALENGGSIRFSKEGHRATV